MKRASLGLALCLSLLLTGCGGSSSPRAAMQNKMNAVAEAANAKDSAALRSALADFLQEVQRQSANADITTTKAEALKRVATRLLQNASALDAASPAPSASPSEAPSPSPSPSPSPQPSPSPSPSPTPPPSPSPIVEISTSPAAGILSPAATSVS